jgi:ribosome-associated protein YbcJ (S4-like RNA binding protein)
MEDVAVTGVITLGQLLKLAGIVDTGGEVKPFLASVAVRVNGEEEERRGRKLAPGDVVEIEAHEPLRLVRAT